MRPQVAQDRVVSEAAIDIVTRLDIVLKERHRAFLRFEDSRFGETALELSVIEFDFRMPS